MDHRTFFTRMGRMRGSLLQGQPELRAQFRNPRGSIVEAQPLEELGPHGVIASAVAPVLFAPTWPFVKPLGMEP